MCSLSLFSAADAASLFRLIAALYPTAQAFVNADKQTVAAWHSMLCDLPAQTLSQAVKRHAACSKYPPSIAEIREAAIKLANPELTVSSGEAWGQVVNTLREGIDRDRLKRLPSTIRDAVRLMGGWYMIARSEQPDTVRAQFMRVYEQCVADEVKGMQIPVHIALEAAPREMRVTLG